jgi:tetratricopeptide (TPR) repeat protein
MVFVLAVGAQSLLAQASGGPESKAEGGGEFERLLKQGFALHQQARYTEAIPILNQARRLEPDDYFANLLLGIDLLRVGKPAEAVPRLESAARANPKEEFPEEYLGEAEAALGHQVLAANAFQAAVKRGKNSEDSLEGWAGFALERFRQLGEALRATPEGVAAAQRLRAEGNGNAPVAAAGGCSTAIPALERRVALHPSAPDVEAAYRLSLCYAWAAGEVAGQLGSLVENAAALHQLRGDVLLRLKGDGAAAEAEYAQALAAHPRDPGLLQRMAEAEWSAGDDDAAAKSAQAALEIDPHRAGALRTLASIAMSNREYDRAIPWLRQLAAEEPGDRATAVELGRALAQSGDAAGAVEWLLPPLKAGYPDEKGALHALLGRALRKLGRETEAAAAEAEAKRLSDVFQNSEKLSAPAAGNGPDANQ